MRLKGVLPLLLLGILATTGRTQEVTGRIEGRILMPDGQPFPDVSVTLSSAGLPMARTVIADARGYFRAVGLPVGSYGARIEYLGYRTVVVEDIPVRLGTTTSLGEIRMELEAIEVEAIVVVADRVIIDPTTTTVGVTLTQQDHEVLPTERDYQSMISLLPQANESFFGDAANIAGSTGLENVYYIDGVNVTDPYRATTGTELPYNFIKEIQVKVGGYEAEYGRALGGIVNVVTHAGSDEFRGNAYGFFTNDALSSEVKPGLLSQDVESFTNYDVGLTLSGPVVREKLWFYAAYNPRVTRQDIRLPGAGTHEDRRTTHVFAGKLTWHPAQQSDVTLSVFGDPTKHDWIGNFYGSLGGGFSLENPDPLLGFREQGGINLSLIGHTMLGDRAMLEAILARSQRNENELGRTERGRTEPLFRDFTTGTQSGGFGYRQEIGSTRTYVRLAGTVFAGRHTLKAGVEYEENRVDYTDILVEPGIIRQVGDSAYNSSLFGQDGPIRNRVPTAFIQDSWRVHDRLTVNAGLRWDGQWFVASGDSVAQSITDQFSPRAGFTLQLGRLGSQKLFGSFGRFYQQLPTFLSRVMHSERIDCFSTYSEDPRSPDTKPDDTQCFPPISGHKVQDLRGEHFDEFNLGYERMLSSGVKLGVLLVRRILREAYGFGLRQEDTSFRLGNYGKGELSFLPDAKRNYTALEITLGMRSARNLDFLVSYIYSRTTGNYTGQYVSDLGLAIPGAHLPLQVPEQGINSTGRLPNDRPHSFKTFGSYRFGFGLTAGAFFTWQSGTPLNEFGATWLVPRPSFLVPRGSAGRTPSIWDLNLRFTYDPRMGLLGPVNGRLIVDLLHVGGQREVVHTDQFHYRALDADGNQTAENPNYGAALLHQPPMMVRLGFELYH